MIAKLLKPYRTTTRALPTGTELEVTKEMYIKLELSGHVAPQFVPKSAIKRRQITQEEE